MTSPELTIDEIEAIDPLDGAKAKKKPSAARRAITNIMKLSLTFGILFYLYRKGMLDLSRVRSVLTDATVFTTTFTLFCFTTLATVVRWHLLLRGQGLKITLLEALKLTMIGTFFNTALPGAVSGDVVKGYYVVRQQPDGRGRIKAFTTLLIDRILGLSGLIFVSFFAMLLNLGTARSTAELRSLCGFITLLWIGVIVFFSLMLVRSRRLKKFPDFLRKLPAGEYLAKLFEAVKTYENCSLYIFKGLAISIAIWITIVGAIILLGRALGGFEHVTAGTYYFLAPFGLLVTAIPIAPAGLGTGHAAFLYLFSRVGANGGADLFTAWVTFQILISLIGGLFYLKYRGHLPKSG